MVIGNAIKANTTHTILFHRNTFAPSNIPIGNKFMEAMKLLIIKPAHPI
jgi:hypothetical protein